MLTSAYLSLFSGGNFYYLGFYALFFLLPSPYVYFLSFPMSIIFLFLCLSIKLKELLVRQKKKRKKNTFIQRSINLSSSSLKVSNKVNERTLFILPLFPSFISLLCFHPFIKGTFEEKTLVLKKKQKKKENATY